VKLASQYLAQRHWMDRLCRFDVVLVQGQASADLHVEHVQNAFEVNDDGQL
jgi:putative endonuclease